MDNLTPMMKQYLSVKENVKDALVFYRLGDFYELFFEDAEIASKELDLVLTGRSAGNNQKAPMCGVPYHASANYIQKLINKGYKVAIVEQMEDPKTVKGLVRRDVVQIVTPGTSFDTEEKQTTIIAAIKQDLLYYVLVLCDITSGHLSAVRIENNTSALLQTLMQYNVKELLIEANFDETIQHEITDKTMSVLTVYENEMKSPLTKKLVSHNMTPEIELAANTLINYLVMTQKRELTHLKAVELQEDSAYLQMDYATQINLELIQSLRSNTKKATLYSYLDQCTTSMGSRMLKEWLTHPLVNKQEILERQDQIEYLNQNYLDTVHIRKQCEKSFDIEKILAKASFGSMNAQDVLRLIQTLNIFISLQQNHLLQPFSFVQGCDPHQPLVQELQRAFSEQAPYNIKDGGTFNSGINDELDELRKLIQEGKSWLLFYEQKQREITGIKNLKVGYTRAFGYYIEISKAASTMVDDSFGYIRKQTLTNGERYISEELQTWETKLNSANDRIVEIETQLFAHYVAIIEDHQRGLTEIAKTLSKIDVLGALTFISHQHGYIRPIFHDGKALEILEGRHPILENTSMSSQYISNSISMSEEDLVFVLTGPNMGGKSTYMRMIALLCIMAQMGCFIPASQASLPILDQIFTRMGASDDILMGQSTFMVEMNEAQLALSKATERSLILFDEIGRGTSTYDGMALAKSIIEYVAEIIKAKTIFSTHYHELTSMAEENPVISNINVQVHEENKHVTFLYKVVEGKADKSYGINVARLAHLPTSVIERASDILLLLEENKHHVNLNQTIVKMNVEPESYLKIKDILNRLDVNQLTPLQAINLLDQLKQIMKEEVYE